MNKILKKISMIICMVLCFSLLLPNHLNAAMAKQTVSGTACVKDGKNLFYKSGSNKNSVLTVCRTGTKATSTKKLSKINSDKFFVKGNTIFFTMKDGIYSMNKDGKSKRRILKGSVKVIAISGKYIYFTNYKNLNRNDVLRITTDGKDKKVLANASIRSNPLMVNGRIYFVDKKGADFRFNYVSLFGKEAKTILNNPVNMYGDLFTDNKSVYVSIDAYTSVDVSGGRLAPVTHQVCAIDSAGKTKVLVTSTDQNLKVLAVSGGMLYYTNESNGGYYDLFKVSVSGGESKLVISSKSLPGAKGYEYFSNILVSGKWIAAVFDCDTKPPVVYYFKTDGKGAKKVTARQIYDITSGKLYYGSTDKDMTHKSITLK